MPSTAQIKVESDFPRLDLTFADDDGMPFLLEASFRLNDKIAVSHKLIRQRPKGKSFRALCILMLLAKHQGESFEDEDNQITFDGRHEQPSWIKTLGSSWNKTSKENYCQKYFNNCRFVSAGRGTGHKFKGNKPHLGMQPSARYHCSKLALRNLNFFKASQMSEGGKGVALTEDELASFAERLEKYEVGKVDGWEAIVPKIVKRTMSDRPSQMSHQTNPALPESKAGASSFVLSAQWDELGNSIRKEMEGQPKAGDWFILCVTPSWLLDWRKVFCAAVKDHKAKIKFACHSEEAAENCPSIRAQWRMHASYAPMEKRDLLAFVRARLETLRQEMKGWAKEIELKPAKTKTSTGSFEFFESQITHPFMAILYVPPLASKQVVYPSTAPEGTWCLLGLYLLFPATLSNRCGLYLNRPGPILDTYYNSVIRFFEQGREEGYLKPTDLFGAKHR